MKSFFEGRCNWFYHYIRHSLTAVLIERAKTLNLTLTSLLVMTIRSALRVLAVWQGSVSFRCCEPKSNCKKAVKTAGHHHFNFTYFFKSVAGGFQEQSLRSLQDVGSVPTAR